MGFDLKKTLSKVGAVAAAPFTAGASLFLDPDIRKGFQRNKQYALPLAAAALGAVAGGPMGAMAAGSATQQVVAGREQVKAVAGAEKKQKILQRREVSRLAKMAYENRFMSGGRSILSTRRTGGKATVGA